MPISRATTALSASTCRGVLHSTKARFCARMSTNSFNLFTFFRRRPPHRGAFFVVTLPACRLRQTPHFPVLARLCEAVKYRRAKAPPFDSPSATNGKTRSQFPPQSTERQPCHPPMLPQDGFHAKIPPSQKILFFRFSRCRNRVSGKFPLDNLSLGDKMKALNTFERQLRGVREQ